MSDPTDDPAAKRERVRNLAASVADRARRKGALYRTIGIKLVEPPYDVHTRAQSLPGPVDDPTLLEEVALELLAEFEDTTARKLGVRVANLSFADQDQAGLDNWEGEPVAANGSSAEPEREPRSQAGHRWQPSGTRQATLSEFL